MSISDISPRCTRISKKIAVEVFVREHYLPYAHARKRSWQVDARIARQYIVPQFGQRQLLTLKRSDVEDWLAAL